MAPEIRRAFGTWVWSLVTLARSPAPVLALAAFVAVWGLAAYEWLCVPESSLLVLLLALVWAIVQALVAVAVVAGAARSAAHAADAQRLRISSFWGFDRRQLAESLLVVLGGLILAILFATIFAWINQHAVEVASFLTFHSEKPVSHVLIEKIYWVLGCLLWIVIAGFLLSFLSIVVRAGWREARKQAWSVLVSCCFKSSFLTGLLSVAVFGGLARLLARWRPDVPVGFWDYTQMAVRLSLVLLLLAGGWLFWMLSLVRLNLPPEAPSPPSPPSA